MTSGTTTRSMTDRAGRTIVTGHERTVGRGSVRTFYLGDPDTRAEGSRIIAQVTVHGTGTSATVTDESGTDRLGIYSVTGAIGAARDLVTAERDRLADQLGSDRASRLLGVDFDPAPALTIGDVMGHDA